MPTVIGVISEEIREAYARYQAQLVGGSPLTKLAGDPQFLQMYAKFIDDAASK